MSQYLKFSRSEVAAHSSTSDCWVIVNDAVLDVTSFLDRHPGGAAVLCKEGRAGQEVTSHFERIGHSKHARLLINDLQVGILEREDDIEAVEPSEYDSLVSKDRTATDKIEKEHAVMWHAQRRKAILKDHPEIENLFGSNPFTCLVGLVTVFVHSYTCLYVQGPGVSWLTTLVLAATIGAVCKMFQFAVNHDICHDTAGEFLETNSFLKRSAMQVLTLPSVGGTMHTYYEFQHVGHHTSLGAQSFDEIQGRDVTYIPKEESGIDTYSENSIRQALFFPSGDGDMLAVGTLSLGKILESWGNPTGDIGSRIYLGEEGLSIFHSWKWLKLLLVQFGHLQHSLMMISVFSTGLLLPPFISLPMFAFPNATANYILKLIRSMSDGQVNEQLSPQAEDVVMHVFVRLVSSVAVHCYLWVILDWWLLYGHLSSSEVFVWSHFFRGFLYLYLSELFLYGFGCHPYMGYFLGVHRSGGQGFESPSATARHTEIQAMSEFSERSRDSIHHGSGGCQPTMSTYSFWAALFSMNLTHHVEHHDFPKVPWNRLPQVTQLTQLNTIHI